MSASLIFLFGDDSMKVKYLFLINRNTMIDSTEKIFAHHQIDQSFCEFNYLSIDSIDSFLTHTFTT